MEWEKITMNKMKKVLALLLSVLLLVSLLTACAGGGAKGAATKFAKAMFDPKGGKTIVDLLPKAFVDAGLEEGTYEDKNAMADAMNDGLQVIADGLEEEYGKYKVTVKAGDVEEWDEDEIEAYNGLMALGNVDMEVKEGADVDLEITIKGKDGKDSQDLTLSVIKADGKWCVDPLSLAMLGM